MTLLARNHGDLTLRVEEVLHGTLPLVPGDVIEGQRFDDRFACLQGCASIAVGEQAFAFYRPAPPALPACEERDACIATCQEERRNEGSPWTSACVCRAGPPSNFATLTDSASCGLPPVNPECVTECESNVATVARRAQRTFPRLAASA